MSYARVAALYDIHGNLPALDAVLADVRDAEPDLVLIGGDVVPGPMPRETIARLLTLDLPTMFIIGNGDREVLTLMRGGETSVPQPFRAGLQWTADQLGPDHANLFAAWPATFRVSVDGIGDVLFCHATPRNDVEIFTKETADDVLAPVFRAAEAPLVVCGHTHMQFERTAGGVRIVNAGSVGMPFGRTGADWALIAKDVELRHTQYDLSAAASRIRATDHPGADDLADKNILSVPAEKDMLERFARAELR